MKKSTLLFFILFFSINFIKADDVIYAGKIYDSKGEIFLLTNLITTNYGVKFSCKKGDSTFEIEYNKIKSVIFEGEPHKISGISYRLGTLKLTSGTVEKVYIRIVYGSSDYTVFLHGNSQAFGSNMKIPLRSMTKIEFFHDGVFSKCPLCNTIYYDYNQPNCSFDKERLISPVGN